MDFILLIAVAINIVLLIVLVLRKPQDHTLWLQEEFRAVRRENGADQAAMRSELVSQFESLNRISMETIARVGETTAVNLENMRTTLDRRLETIRAENEKSMEQIRHTVDKELSETLASGLDQSFKSVSTQLEQVFKSMGEMRTMASDITGLKNVLTNVKNRGTWGEVQLGAILEDILAPGQYESQCAIADGRERVDFAVKLPGGQTEESIVYLPIDAKFPLDRYTAVLEAESSADAEALAQAKNNLIRAIKEQARDIKRKYILPPGTTDYAILFVPSEGLYSTLAAEDVPYTLQRESNILLAGPSTLSALLNSIQIGFRTLAIEKRADDIMALLGAVKTTFGNFANNLEATRKSLNAATNNLERASGSSRRIMQQLRSVEETDLYEAKEVLKGASLDEILTLSEDEGDLSAS